LASPTTIFIETEADAVPSVTLPLQNRCGLDRTHSKIGEDLP